MRMSLMLAAMIAAAFAPATAMAQEAPGAAPERNFTTRHTGTFGGRRIDYVATAGDTVIRLPNGRSARMFSIAYTQAGAGPGRPVTFLFNGGPGSSSIYLHMGAFGPRRIDLPDDATTAGLAPYSVQDNPSSLLDVTDLVFIDPVGSGFSHAVAPAADADFSNLIDDASSFSEFVRSWLIRNGRENSPKFILGESYGSVRAGVMVRNLRSEAAGKIMLNGLILLGQDMDTTITQQAPANDMPFVVYLPTYAVTAWYHNRVPHEGRTIEQVYNEAREFARTELQAALFLGSALPASERARIAARMSQMIGLPAALIERENLRIGTAVFLRELLRDQGRIIIRSDTRFTTAAPQAYNEREAVSELPGLGEAFAAAGSSYIRGELGVNLPEPFRVRTEGRWDYTLPDGINVQQTYHDVTPYVATAMRDNPQMRLFFGSGHFDLLAAPLSVERNYTHAGLPLDRITAVNYPTGHMIFVSRSSLARLATDLRGFITGASNARAVPAGTPQ